MTKLLPLAAACALLLAGCASTEGLATHGQLRDADSLAAGKSLGNAHLSAAAWPSARWWSAFASDA